MMKLKTSIFSAAIAGSLLSTAALAQPEFSKWDADGNGNLSLQEWDASIESNGIFASLDENANGIFDIGEADEEVFTYDIGMDLDDGGHIERQEFTVGTFNMLDSNDDDMLSQQEFSEFGAKAAKSDLLSKK